MPDELTYAFLTPAGAERLNHSAGLVLVTEPGWDGLCSRVHDLEGEGFGGMLSTKGPECGLVLTLAGLAAMGCSITLKRREERP